MSKRSVIAGALLLVLPVLGLALLRMRAPSQKEATAQQEAAPLPEAIANLQRRIDSGSVKLGYDENFRILRALLETLDIPTSSQSLVFGKNSAQLFLISPQTREPFTSTTMSISGMFRARHTSSSRRWNPVTGPVFYTLDQVKLDKPRFTLQPSDCLACHDHVSVRQTGPPSPDAFSAFGSHRLLH
jgi:hypothetical protein